MKNRLTRIVSLWLAGALQVMPLVRSMLPALSPGAAPSGWAIVFRWAAGAVAYLGFDAVSSASTIAISPPNATVGQPYVGTVTYSGGHSGSVSSMELTNACLGALTPLFSGLSIVYNGGNTATVSGTPTAAGNFAFTLKIFDSSGCGGGGNSDIRTTTLVIGTSGGTGVAPVISAPPQSVTAQIGSDALLSAGASGSPPPKYYWYVGVPSPGTLVSTNSTLEFPSVQLTNAGLYTVTASNATGTASAFAYLSVVLTPGTNQLLLNFTNYYPQGHALTMYSYLTNAPSGSNVYKWQYNFVDITPYTTNGNNLSLTAAQVTGSKSGIYSVVFNSVVGATTVVNQQQYYSFWSFGTPPAITAQPHGTNVSAGADAAFNVAATGSNTLSYQWVFNDTNILSGQTGTSLNLSAVQPSDAGGYSVIVTNFYGSITSSPAILTVNASGGLPTFSSEPVSVSALVGQNASFSVLASGTTPISYQWQKDGASLSDGGVYSGTLTNVLHLTGVELTNAGNYSVMVSNASGSTNSSSAALYVALPPRINLGSIGGGGVQLSATTSTGLVYVVESTTNLASPWLPVATNTVPGTGELLFTNPITGSVQFFRLQFP